MLTDKFPHARVFRGVQAPHRAQIHFRGEPVDATHVPSDLHGLRTLFTSFHHFPPSEARRILQDAVRKNEGIAIFEAAGRHVTTVLLVWLLTVGYFLAAPFLQPFRWSRIAFTYLLPVVPFVLFFDGLVSCLRVYSPEELRELVAGFASGYRWESGVERRGLLGVPVTYLIGRPDLAAGKQRHA
jgi:hypothetical protein